MKQIALGALLGGVGVFALMLLRSPGVLQVTTSVPSDGSSSIRVEPPESPDSAGLEPLERTETVGEPQAAPPAMGGAPDSEPALLGLVAPAPSSTATVEPQFNNDEAMYYYKVLMVQRQALDRRIEAGETLQESHLDVLEINKAVVTCMNQQRFYYLGPASLMPPYSHLQSAETRYIATVIKDQGIIIELTRGEFPGVFEHYSRLDVESK